MRIAGMRLGFGGLVGDRLPATARNAVGAQGRRIPVYAVDPMWPQIPKQWTPCMEFEYRLMAVSM